MSVATETSSEKAENTRFPGRFDAERESPIYDIETAGIDVFIYIYVHFQ